ncbi:ATP-binding protein, partial [Nocardia pseudovaccinii]|uniref:ATP-binding protein n=1 Tax=Nocardia pseudovaccinii TaxID=189540 RepID=UPI001470FF1F
MRASAVACSVIVAGLTGQLSEIAAEITPGLDSVTVSAPSGDPAHAGIDRVRAAVAGGGWAWPQGRVTLTFSPSASPVIEGMHDLALAAAVLAATAPGTIPAQLLAEVVLLGQLAPDGRLRSVRGILPAVLAARDRGRTVVIVPCANLAEAALAPGVTVLGAEHLAAVLAWLGGADRALTGPAAVAVSPEFTGLDLGDVRGHYRARWALEVAAA